jgi:NodT family efflux transporter outer membrane factor (OMF) lipoprotein
VQPELLLDLSREIWMSQSTSSFTAISGAVTATLAATLVLAACSTPVAKPSVQMPQRFTEAKTAEASSAASSGATSGAAAPVQPVPAAATGSDAAWWERYGDPVLSDLIRRAERENRDVKIAAERLRAARAEASISRSWLYPSIDAVGGGISQQTTYGASVQQKLPDIKAAVGGADVSWEIDLSGRLRAGASAARSDALAAEDAMRGVRLLVLTDVASNYFTLVGALHQLDTVRAIAAAHDETLHLVQSRQRVGLATPFDIERAQAAASAAHAAIPPLETVAAVSRHRIAALVGDQAANATSITPWNGDIAVPATQPGQPAQLLERRPDLLAAKAQLDAANARRRQAKAEYFPRLFATALLGRGTADLAGEAIGPARYTNAAALLAMPLFNAGRTKALNDIAGSGQNEAVLHYEDSIVRALEDVENALTTLRDEHDRQLSLQSAAASADAAYGRAQSLYSRGQIDLLPLLDAQRTRLSVRVSANDSDTQMLLDSVQLYKALGGGWQVFEPQSGATTARSTESPKS